MYNVDTIALRKLMIEKGLNTNVSLSGASGIDRNTIGDILNNKARPSSDVMYRLAETLGMSPEVAGKIFFA